MAEDNFTRRTFNNVESNEQDPYARLTNSINNLNSNIEKLLQNGRFTSQGNARDQRTSRREDLDFPDSNSNWGPFGQRYANSFRTGAKQHKGFLDSLEESLIASVGGADFKRALKGSLRNFAKQMGSSLDDLQDDLGKNFGKVIGNEIKKSKLGKSITDKFKSITDSFFEKNKNLGADFKEMIGKEGAGFKDVLGFVDKIDLGKLNGLKTGVTKLLGGVEGAAGGLAAMGVAALGVVVVMKALEIVGQGVHQVFEGFSDLLESAKESMNRYTKSRQTNLEKENERLRKDIETLVTEPFEILKKAADEVYSAWSQNIRLVAGTQGYSKADLQNLMADYAVRLRAEGLGNVISTTDVYNNLAKVIQSGLTGQAAVEFAYQATKYGAAIPNQDFFGYAESYASVAANAIAAGKSESEALKIANENLRDFANSLLYTTRILSGGYATGLKSSESIYSSAVKIAQAARSENISGIAQSLLAIQGYVGSIAPDLVNSITDKIYSLATGGNSAELVALRSLAGINASNTEFIKMFSQNPQQVLRNIFANLGTMVSQYSGAYMEKAEGYASLFGLSPEALQRIDFVSLASALEQISTDLTSDTGYLAENFNLLQEGQTTTTAEQLKIAQINKYMVEEGLAYVIDNEAAQMIQQHMWDEQLAKEIMEAEYGINLVGSSAQALQKIISGIDKVISIVSPAAWGKKLADVLQAKKEVQAQEEDIGQILRLGLVGSGNVQDYINLITRGQDLGLTRTLVGLMGGVAHYYSGWYSEDKLTNILTSMAYPTQNMYDTIAGWFEQGRINRDEAIINGLYPSNKFGTASYSWGSLGTVSKGSANLAASILKASQSSELITQQTVSNVEGIASTSVAFVTSKIDKMLSDEYLNQQFVLQGKSFEEWKQSARAQGITDLESAIEKAGYTLNDIEDYYSKKQIEVGSQAQLAQREEEQKFHQAGMNFWSTQFWNDFNTPLTYLIQDVSGKLDTIITVQADWRSSQLDKLQKITDNQIDWKNYFSTAWIESAWRNDFIGESGYFTRFFNAFTQRFVEDAYNNSGYTYSDVQAIQRQEELSKNASVMELAEYLTSNLGDLKDPQNQTNALLAQILVVISAIMSQNGNVPATSSLPSSLSGLARGITNTVSFSSTPGR